MRHTTHRYARMFRINSKGLAWLACMMLMCSAGSAALADAVKISNFWLSGVSVQSIDEGMILFINARGDQVQQPLEKLQGLKVDALPQLEQADEATEAGEHDQAVKLLQAALGEARQPWQKQYLNWRLSQAANQAGQATVAVQAYLALVQAKADAHFLAEPAFDSVASASDADKRKIAAAVAPVARRTSGETRKILDDIAKAAAVAASAPAPVETAQPAANEAAAPQQMAEQTQSESPAPAAAAPMATPVQAPATPAASAVTLPQNIADDAVTQLLRQGQFQAALDAAEHGLKSSGQLSLRLYQKGMAQLGLADQTGDPALYKDAGLSFMRVIVYFPRSGLVGPAQVEAGYVHAKIGDEQQARKLYDRAQLRVLEEDEPAYHQRLIELINQLP